MARRTTPKMPKPKDSAAITPRRLKVEQDMVNTIMANIDPGSLAFEAKGMFTTSVKYKDATFKSKPVEAGDDFALTSVYRGARGQLIFCFRPVDPKEYDTIELDETKVFPLFEGFEGMVIKSLGYNPGPTLVGTRERAYTWKEATTDFRRKRFAELEKADEEVKVKVAKEKADTYSDDPMYGSW